MTRQEEIDNAKTAFYKRVLEDDYYYDPRDRFEEGAKWADKNAKSPWISAGDDLPCKHEELLERNNETVLVIVKCKHFIDVDYMRLYGNGWIWVCHNDYDITRWMPIPEPPK